MTDLADLKDFAAELLSDIQSRVDQPDSELSPVEAFTERIIPDLVDAGEIDEGRVCYYRYRGMEVSGYEISAEGETVDLFISVFYSGNEISTISATDIDSCFKRLLTVWKKAGENHYLLVEESSPSFDMFHSLAEVYYVAHRLRLFVLTNTIARVEYRSNDTIDGLNIEYNIWDLRRLHRHYLSGKDRELPRINFSDYGHTALPALRTHSATDAFDSYLMIIPGDLLSRVYSDYGERLLERNVRSFLQIRGKVNRGIRDTIRDFPERFLAYNNGISATADGVEVIELDDGTKAIASISSFQIVNGGQTTATVHYAATKDKLNVSRIGVQCKLTVVANHFVNEIVPLISRYSNTQNKINEADFSANDDLHVEIEKLSRRIFTPPTALTGRQTRWFYERARGQYNDELGRDKTRARIEEFKRVNPPNQKFTKTDLAKFIHAWEGRADLVSRGAQKNFVEFSVRIARSSGDRLILPDINQSFFEHLIAKAIIYQETENIVTKLKQGGYRANVVAYTVTLIAKELGEHISLDNIWQNQTVPDAIKQVIEELATRVHSVIVNPPGAKNITEWCKTQRCLDEVRKIKLQNSTNAINALQATTSGWNNTTSNTDVQSLIERMEHIQEYVWTSISRWGKLTGKLTMPERAFIDSMALAAQNKRKLGPRSAQRAFELLTEAKKRGYVLPSGISIE